MKALKRGDFKIAGDHFQIAVNEAKEIGNENAVGASYNNLGRAYESLSDFKKAIEFYQLALPIAKDTGN